MSSHHSRARTGGDTEQPSLPPADPPPPPPEDAERDGRGNHHVEEPNDGPEPNAGRGAGKVNQEAVTAAVLKCTVQSRGDTEDACSRLARRSCRFGFFEDRL